MDCKSYKVKYMKKPAFNPAAISEKDFDGIEKAEISIWKWEEGYTPETFAQMMVVNGKYLVIKLECKESKPMARYKNYGDPVFTDSCMEFFFSAERYSPYVNIEMNSIGGTIMAYGPDRNDRKPLNEFCDLPKVQTNIYLDSWNTRLAIPLSDIEKLFGKKIQKGSTLYGNFYKCGDDCEPAHYGMWNEIMKDTPTFHEPEYFGEFEF